MSKDPALTIYAKIIRYFLAHKDVLVSRDDIAHLIYEGAETEVAPMSISGYVNYAISRAREEMKARKIKGGIVTSVGRGYLYTQRKDLLK